MPAVKVIPPARLARLRLAAQGLTPETAAPDGPAAARRVLGIQAQNTRAAGLALRSRVRGIERVAVDGGRDLIRTWTVRGTVHLIATDDLPWMHSLTGPRNRRRFDALMAKRGNPELARDLLPDLVELLEPGPLTRAALLAGLAERGRRSLDPSSVNILMPWAAARSLVLGLPDGRFRAAQPPPDVTEEEALATLARRYIEGYGPAGAADLARWSGLPLGTARRALDSCGELEPASGDLLAAPGVQDADPPPAPPALLLAAFDTTMLGWRSREPLVASADDRRILPGGGMIRPVVLARGSAVGTWRILGSGSRRRLELEWFRRPPAPETVSRALAAEIVDVGRFLGLEALEAPA